MAKGVKVIVTDKMLADWSAALDEGYGYKHVGEIFGVHRDLIRKHLPGRGWTHAQITAQGTMMKHHNEKMRVLERKGKIIRPHDPTADRTMDMLERRFAGRNKHQHLND